LDPKVNCRQSNCDGLALTRTASRRTSTRAASTAEWVVTEQVLVDAQALRANLMS
jgi:hypothetical protein